MDSSLPLAPHGGNLFIHDEFRLYAEMDDGDRQYRSDMARRISEIRNLQGREYATMLELVPDLTLQQTFNEPGNGFMQAISRTKSEIDRAYDAGKRALFWAKAQWSVFVLACMVDIVLLATIFAPAFTDDYGAITATGLAAIALRAVQGVLTFLALKTLFDTRVGLRLAPVLGLLAVAYALSIAAVAAFQGVDAAVNAVSGGLSWQPTTITSHELSAPRWWANFFWWGIPYFIIPGVAALFHHKATVNYETWKIARDAWYRFHATYRSLFSVQETITQIRSEFDAKLQAWADTVKAPVRELILQGLAKAAKVIEFVNGARSRGEREIYIPGPGGMTIANPDYEYAMAVEARSTYDASYLDRIFQQWAQARGYTPDGRKLIP